MNLRAHHYSSPISFPSKQDLPLSPIIHFPPIKTLHCPNFSPTCNHTRRPHLRPPLGYGRISHHLPTTPTSTTIINVRPHSNHRRPSLFACFDLPWWFTNSGWRRTKDDIFLEDAPCSLLPNSWKLTCCIFFT